LTSSRLELASCHRHNDLRRLAMGTDDAVVACSLDREELAERGARWDAVATRTFLERVPTERGVQLVFLRDTGVEDELRGLAELERKCCAFAEWTVTADDGRVVVHVDGSSDEGVAAVQAMFRRLG
jgi:hypothetical protein